MNTIEARTKWRSLRHINASLVSQNKSNRARGRLGFNVAFVSPRSSDYIIIPSRDVWRVVVEGRSACINTCPSLLIVRTDTFFIWSDTRSSQHISSFAPTHYCVSTPNEVPNDSVDMSSWESSACYPRRTFDPLSESPSTRGPRITMADFRLCSTCRSHSQAGFDHYALQLRFALA
jgi:hypothetical protein